MENSRSISDEIKFHTKEVTESPAALSYVPLVSVVVIAYNHEKYIEECILSIVHQETNFKVEIIVCDDASNDTTPEIIQSLCMVHPNIRFYKGKRINNISILNGPSGRYNAFKAIDLAQGKYLSWMDGDDYWIDRFKLQKQVDILETRTNWSACFTLGKLLFDDGTLKDVWTPTLSEFDATECLNVLRSKELASSRMFRTQLFKGPVPEWLLSSFSDKHMDLWSAINGPIGWIKDQTTHYRIHKGGIFQGATSEFKSQLAFYRTEQLLKFGHNDTWLTQSDLLRMFLSLVKSFDSHAIRQKFPFPNSSTISGFGAFGLLSMKNKIAVLTYSVIKKIQWALLPLDKGSISENNDFN